MRSILAIGLAGSMALGAHHVASHSQRTWHPRPRRPHVAHVASLGLYGRRHK